MKVALVVMPWTDPKMSPLGAAVLKAHLTGHGFETDVLCFNVRMTGRVGLALSTALNEVGDLWSEWFFSYHLFGRGGSGELSETLEDLAELPDFERMVAYSGQPLERFRRLLETDVPAFIDDCLTSVPWEQYGLVGFSSVFFSHAACLLLAKRLKERFPGLRIVLGGSNVKGPMGPATLELAPWIDAVVDGEGEAPLLALAQRLDDQDRTTEPIPGLVERGQEPSGKLVSSMAEVPRPDHSDYLREVRACPQIVRPPVLLLEGSRGCWYGEKAHCTFCGIPDEDLRFRAKSPERLVDDIMDMLERYGENYLHFVDLIMSMDQMERALPRLAEIRQAKGLDFDIYFNFKSNLTRRQLALLAAAGITRATLGIETLSTPLLKRMRKGVSAIQNIQALKFAAAVGVAPVWTLLYGIPGEDPRDYDEMLERLPALSHLPPPSGADELRYHRFSPYQETPRSYGLTLRHDPIYELLYPAARTDLGALAYYFESTGGGPAEHAMRAKAAAEWWLNAWRRSFFACRRGTAAVELYDCRPREVRGEPEFREERLTGLEARLFRAAETIQTLGQLAQACPEAEPAAIEAALDRMTRNRWLYREGRSFLSLAIPVRSLPAPQKMSLDLMLQSLPSRKICADAPEVVD